MSLVIQTRWPDHHAQAYFPLKCAKKTGFESCDKDNKMRTTQSEAEPTGMPESLLTKESSPTCRSQNLLHAATFQTSPDDVPTRNDVGEISSFKAAETLSKPPAVVKTCKITSQSSPDPSTEMEFLESVMAHAVRFIATTNATNENLMMALTLLRREAWDCSVYPKNAKQLLEALDSLSSDQSSSATPWPSSSICSRCLQENNNTNSKDLEKGAVATEEAEEYREYIDFQDNDVQVIPARISDSQENNSAPDINETESTANPDYREDSVPVADIEPISFENAQPIATEEAHLSPSCGLHSSTEDGKKAKDELPWTDDRIAAKQAMIARLQVLVAENKRMKRRQLCRLCQKMPANATLLPCGHLVYCLDCAQSLSECGVCHKEILGDVKTFLS